MFFSYGLWLLAAAVVLITAVLSEVPLFGAYSKGAYSAGGGVTAGAAPAPGAAAGGSGGRPVGRRPVGQDPAPTPSAVASTVTRPPGRTTVEARPRASKAPVDAALQADVGTVTPLVKRLEDWRRRQVHRFRPAARDHHRDLGQSERTPQP
jgi:hypothetical protein